MPNAKTTANIAMIAAGTFMALEFVAIVSRGSLDWRRVPEVAASVFLPRTPKVVTGAAPDPAATTGA